MSNQNQDELTGLGDSGFREEPTDEERARLEQSMRGASQQPFGVGTGAFNFRPQPPRPTITPQTFQPQVQPPPPPPPPSVTIVQFGPFVPEFTIVDIDPAAVGDMLSAYCHRGSRIIGVDVGSINCTVKQLPPAGSTVDIPWCLANGLKFFDAIIWMSAPAAIRPQLVLAPNPEQVEILTNGEISKAIFYIYFFLLTQAKYPTQLGDNQPIPSFLRTILGLTSPPTSYVQKVCTFNVNLFDPTWIRSVRFRGFGQETLSRFGLGVAGYRLFAPFALLTPRPDTPEIARPAYAFARTIAVSEPTWSIHPITRNPRLLTERGNLNKNLANLMLECFTPADLQSLVDHKQLYSMPTKQIGYDNWKTWNPDPGMALQDPIFPVNTIIANPPLGVQPRQGMMYRAPPLPPNDQFLQPLRDSVKFSKDLAGCHVLWVFGLDELICKHLFLVEVGDGHRHVTFRMDQFEHKVFYVRDEKIYVGILIIPVTQLTINIVMKITLADE